MSMYMDSSRSLSDLLAAGDVGLERKVSRKPDGTLMAQPSLSDLMDFPIEKTDLVPEYKIRLSRDEILQRLNEALSTAEVTKVMPATTRKGEVSGRPHGFQRRRRFVTSRM